MVEEFKKDQLEQAKIQALQDQQEREFYSYAERCLSEWKGSGKNVKPLVMELKNYKKKVL